MWRKATIKDLAATLSQKEIDEYRKSPSVDSCDDPIEDLLERTTAMVRSYCRANGQIALSRKTDELPESLISPAMDYAAFDVLKRQPGQMHEWRRAAREQAIALFDKVARNDVTPESAEAEDTEAYSARPSFVTCKRERLKVW